MDDNVTAVSLAGKEEVVLLVCGVSTHTARLRHRRYFLPRTYWRLRRWAERNTECCFSFRTSAKHMVGSAAGGGCDLSSPSLWTASRQGDDVANSARRSKQLPGIGWGHEVCLKSHERNLATVVRTPPSLDCHPFSKTRYALLRPFQKKLQYPQVYHDLLVSTTEL